LSALPHVSRPIASRISRASPLGQLLMKSLIWRRPKESPPVLAAIEVPEEEEIRPLCEFMGGISQQAGAGLQRDSTRLRQMAPHCGHPNGTYKKKG
jgi:hypothetical protein